MHIIVSGATGVVGNGICKWLLNQQHQVTAIVNTNSNNFENKKYNEISIDLKSENIEIDFQSIDAFIHCAAVIPNKNSTYSDEDIFNINTAIDGNVLDFCKKNNLKVIYISTAYLYENQHNIAYNEQSKVNASNDGYLKSKLNGERLMLNADATIFRITSPYGNIKLQKNVMNTFYQKAITNESIVLNGKGMRQQNFIHTYDIAEACYYSILKNSSGIFNLGYSKTYSMLVLAEEIIKELKSDSTIVYNNCDEELQNVNFDFSKMNNAFNWQPQIDLKTGLRLIISQ